MPVCEKERVMRSSRKFNQALFENLEGRTLLTGVALGLAETTYDGGTQLRITGTNGNDQITVKQTVAGLQIGNTGNWSKTITDPISSIWINGEGGNNSVVIDASVKQNCTIFGGGVNDTISDNGAGNDTLYGGTGKNTIQAGSGNDTLVSLGSTSDTLKGGTGHDSFWTDNKTTEKIQNLTAAEASSGAVHRVSGYYNIPVVTGKTAAAKAKSAQAAAAALAQEPGVDAGITYASFSSDPIFSSAGPSENDIYQGQVGDCYYLSVLSSVAKVDPARISQSILDLGNGYVLVALNHNGSTAYVHEDESLPVYSDGTLAYAGLGAQNSTWVALMEKAWCYVRTSVVSYDSIDSGWMDEAYSALGGRPASTYSATNAASLLNLNEKDLTAGQGVTFATVSGDVPDGMLSSHAYTVDSVGLNAKGVASTLTLRNPWGCGADGTGNGYITITAAQAYDAFTGMVAANV